MISSYFSHFYTLTCKAITTDVASQVCIWRDLLTKTVEQDLSSGITLDVSILDSLDVARLELKWFNEIKRSINVTEAYDLNLNVWSFYFGWNVRAHRVLATAILFQGKMSYSSWPIDAVWRHWT